MDDYSFDEEQFLLNECEIRPNRNAARAMLYAMVVVIITWLANEFGIYRVDKLLMREGAVIALIMLLIPQIIQASPALRAKRSSKYIMVICLVVTVFVVGALITFHVTLTLILPLLLAMQYRSRKVGWLALIGSTICTFLSPVLGYLIGAWDTLFLQVLLELCGFSLQPAAEQFYSVPSSVGQILLYISLPHELIVLVTALVMFTVIDSGKKSLNDQLTIKRSNERILRMQEGIINGMASVIESRDGSTGEHVANTRYYVSVILNYMLKNGIRRDKVTREYADLVTGASILHDIGKISIPDAILNKPGRFTPEEFEIMKTHTACGDEMIEWVFGSNADPAMLNVLHAVVASHHEKWDGTGYPKGLRGEDIPLEGRVMAIADVFDALISKRVYKEAYTVDEAYRILEEEAGTHLDGELVEIFKAVRPEIEQYVKTN